MSLAVSTPAGSSNNKARIDNSTIVKGLQRNNSTRQSIAIG